MITPQSPTPDTYHVAMKAFIRKGARVLILSDPHHGGEGDLPGGRIGVQEYAIPFEEILRREIAEELGPDFLVSNNGLVAVFRHRRPERMSDGLPEVKIVMLGFELEYLGGEIQLSDEHSGYEWVPVEDAPDKLPGGQKEGMQKYLAYLADPHRRVHY